MLRAKDFTFNYPGLKAKALCGVSFNLERGEVLGLVGPVGAGKTTLCMSLAGFVPRVTGGESSGDLEVAGLDPREMPGGKMAQHVGLVFENFAAQITQVKVLDEVMAPLLNRGVPLAEAEERAREMLERVGLGGLNPRHKRTWELSGGQQQRVAVAATLSVAPEILILDSATGMLDPEGTEEVRRIIAELAGETTMVVAENDADFLLGIANRMLVLDKGEVVADGPADEILRDADLLSRFGGVEPPVAVQVARALGLEESPLTEDEFQRMVGDVEVRSGGDTAAGPEERFGEPLIRIEDVTYKYRDGTAAIDGVSIQVCEGEVHAVVGGNGAGKTTLAKMIVGLQKPTKGKILLGDANTNQWTAADLAWRVGTSFQNPDDQISERTVREEIAFPLQRRRYEAAGWFKRREKYSEDYIEERVLEACELAGLEEKFLEEDPSLLPGGLRRLVTMAEALALDPSIVLVLDEPRVGLDAGSRRRVMRTVKRLKEMRRAVIIIEHDMDLVCEIADTATVLNGGKVTLQGPIHEVFAKKNWGLLTEMYLQPPRAARLAHSIGTEALNAEELRRKIIVLKESS
jgi:energy-coupling factor transport system ATP-binding protein